MKLLLALLPWCKTRHAALAAVDAVPALLDLPDEDDAEADIPVGCGWFDSSHELQHGLVVHEHAAPEALASALPLVQWLDLHLSGWPAAARPA